jgi:hypothetical protein
VYKNITIQYLKEYSVAFRLKFRDHVIISSRHYALIRENVIEGMTNKFSPHVAAKFLSDYSSYKFFREKTVNQFGDIEETGKNIVNKTYYY